jgi:hypothetical protein
MWFFLKHMHSKNEHAFADFVVSRTLQLSVFTVCVRCATQGESRDILSSAGAGGEVISYESERVIGHGSFGVVFQVRCGRNKIVPVEPTHIRFQARVTSGNNEVVAIKKVLQDRLNSVHL